MCVLLQFSAILQETHIITGKIWLTTFRLLILIFFFLLKMENAWNKFRTKIAIKVYFKSILNQNACNRWNTTGRHVVLYLHAYTKLILFLRAQDNQTNRRSLKTILYTNTHDTVFTPCCYESKVVGTATKVSLEGTENFISFCVICRNLNFWNVINQS